MATVAETAWLRLPHVTPATVAEAVTTVMDDEAAARLWAGAAQVQLPNWAAFAEALANWAQPSGG